MMTGQHSLVADYLQRLQADAVARLPRERADELVADIADHLDEAERRGGEADLRNAIDRLGTPGELVDAAGGETQVVGGPLTEAGAQRSEQPARPDGRGDIAAVVCLAASLVTGVVWPLSVLLLVAGVVLLLMSRRFTVIDKVLGMVAYVVLGGPLLALVLGAAAFRGQSCVQTTTEVGDTSQTCTSAGASPVYGIAVLAAVIAFDVYVTWRLSRRLRRP